MAWNLFSSWFSSEIRGEDYQFSHEPVLCVHWELDGEDYPITAETVTSLLSNRHQSWLTIAESGEEIDAIKKQVSALEVTVKERDERDVLKKRMKSIRCIMENDQC